MNNRIDKDQFDPFRYKLNQCREWGLSAPGWRRHWKLWEQGVAHVNERLVALAEIRTGHRVLDVATGLGEPALTAAVKVGPTGRVVATDISSEMLSLASEEASLRGLKQIEFRLMDAEKPNLPTTEGFQAILCRWGLMFMPNLTSALPKLRSLLVSGGRISAAVWGPPEDVPMASLPMDIVRKICHIPPPQPNVPGTFCLSDPNLLKRKFCLAGFKDPAVEYLNVTLEYASADHFIQEREATSANLRLLLKNASSEKRAKIHEAISEAVEHYRHLDGSIKIPNKTLLVVGRA